MISVAQALQTAALELGHAPRTQAAGHLPNTAFGILVSNKRAGHSEGSYRGFEERLERCEGKL